MINRAYSKLLPKNPQIQSIDYQFRCQLTNISECLPIENQAQVNVKQFSI